MNSIPTIRMANDQSFARVILTYKNKARGIKEARVAVERPVNFPKILGDDVEEVSRKMIGIINFRVEMSNTQAEDCNPLHDRHSSVYFSFDNTKDAVPIPT